MRNFVFFASMFLVLACTSVSTAQFPGLSGNPNGTPGMEDYYTNGYIGSETNPTGVYLDPNAGPWIKHCWVNNGVFNFNEWVQIQNDPTYPTQPGPPWTDWDEVIKDPSGNWSWQATAPTKVDVYTYDSSNNPVYKKTVLEAANSTNTYLEFDFNPPEFPVELLNIQKTLVWSGPGSAPVGTYVTVWEYPTPEPATIVLLISGLLALGLGYIRQRK